jgi:DNA polymerase-3 subunit delta
MARRAGKSAKDVAVYVIEGEETLVNAEYMSLLDRLIPVEQRTLGLYVADAQVDITEVFDELHTLPFLADRRVVAVRKAEDFIVNNREVLAKYIDNPSPYGTLILTVSKLDKRLNVTGKLKKAGEVISVASPTGEKLLRRLAEYAQDAYGKKLSSAAARLLVDLVGDDVTRLYSEVDKLGIYTADEKAIGVEHVERLVGYNRTFDAFNVIDACFAGDVSRATSRLRKMFDEDKSAEYKIVGAFAYQLRTMFMTKALLEKGYNKFEAAKGARLWHNRDAVLRRLANVSLRRIGEQIRKLASIDYTVKRGQGQVQVEMEQVVLGLTTQGRNQAVSA